MSVLATWQARGQLGKITNADVSTEKKPCCEVAWILAVGVKDNQPIVLRQLVIVFKSRAHSVTRFFKYFERGFQKGRYLASADHATCNVQRIEVSWISMVASLHINGSTSYRLANALGPAVTCARWQKKVNCLSWSMSAEDTKRLRDIENALDSPAERAWAKQRKRLIRSSIRRITIDRFDA